MTDLVFSSHRFGRFQLANAIAMAPLTRQRATVAGVPEPIVADYYGQRAGAGLIIAEGTQPSLMGQGYCRTPGIHAPEQIAAWRAVTDRVHQGGGHMALQIMHAGRIAHRLNRLIPDAPVAPSAIPAQGMIWTDQEGMQPLPVPRALAADELPALVEEFVTAARNALAAGFDAVEIHAANGYLLNQFLASNSNQRSDGWGGSVAGRIRLVVEVVDAVAAAIGADRTAIRISPGHMFNDLVDGNPMETHVALLRALPTADMAYVHLMLPDAFAAQLNNAGDPRDVLAVIRANCKGRLIAAGGYDLDKARQALAFGLVDMVAVGRPFIANPDLVRRWRDGLPLAQPREDRFYTPGPEGYSDYPAWAEG